MARIRFDKLIDYYLPTHEDFYHPENTQELTGNIQGDKIHIDEAVTIGDSNAPYAQYEFVTLGETDNQKVFYLSLFGKDASKEPLQIVEDIEASNAKALRVTAGHTAVFQTPYPYNPQTLKKMVVRLKAITKGDIRVGLVGISNKATVKPNGDVGFPTATTDVDFYEIVVSEDNVDNIGYDYQTLMGYFKNVVNNPLTDNNPETDEPQTFPTLNPNAPYALRKHTTDVALAFKCLEGEYYIDSLEILDVENYYTDIPGAPEEGPPGLDGLNTAVVFLYKRSATTPNKPSTTATYNFTTGVLTGHNNGWSQNVQAIDGNPLWVIQATVSALASEETATILPAKWGTQIKLVEDGADGATGASGINQATIYLYQRKASEPNVLDIADPITYKFSDGTITGSLGDWFRSVPAGNLPLYVTLAVAIGNGATDNIPRSEWTYPVQMVKDGVDGEDYEGIELITVPSDIMITKRGHIQTPYVTITAKLHNITGAITWTATDGTLELVDPPDDTVVKLLVDTVVGENSVIKAVVGSYESEIELTKIYTGSTDPYNFGMLATVNELPFIVPWGEPLTAGDYFLWGGETVTIEDLENTGHIFFANLVRGQIYEYQSIQEDEGEESISGWGISSNGNLVMTLFDGIAEILKNYPNTPNIMASAVIGKLAVIEAFINELMVQDLEMGVGGVIRQNYTKEGKLDDENLPGLFLGNGKLKANDAELIGTLRTGDDVPEKTSRVGIRDRSGITEGPTFVGSGNDNLIIISEGTVAGEYEIIVEDTDKTVLLDTDTKLPDLPPLFTTGNGVGSGVSYSPDGQHMAVAHGGSPYITVYKRTGDTYTKLPALTALPISGRGVSYSPDGQHMAVTYMYPPYITVYKRTGDTYTTLPDLPALVNTGNGVSYSPDGQHMAVAHTSSPYITVYKRTGDTYITLPALTALPSTGYNVSYSPDGQHMAVAHGGSPYITVYKRTGDTYTKLPALTALPGVGSGVSYSPDGQHMAVGHFNSPYITVYKRTGDTYTKLPDLTALPGAGNGVSYSPDGQHMAVAHSNSPSIAVYKRTGDTYTKLPDLTALASLGSGVSYSPDGQHMAVAHSKYPCIAVYKRYELSDSIKWRKVGNSFSSEIDLYPLRNITVAEDTVIRFSVITGNEVGDKWTFKKDMLYGLSILDASGVEYVRAFNGELIATQVWGAVFN